MNAVLDSTVDEIKRDAGSVKPCLARLRGCHKTGPDKYQSRCPFHKSGREENASFGFFVTSGVWIYKCLACGVKGNVFQFIQRVDNITFPEAVKGADTQ